MSPEEIAAVRGRYYNALREGHTKEEASQIANSQDDDAHPAQVQSKVSASPPPRPKITPPPVSQPLPRKPGQRQPDDLTRIRGIGPGTAAKLGSFGVTSFHQIASWTDADVEEFDKKLGLAGRAARADWRGQARSLLAEQVGG
jgi:predicted flap endonuclease-1-like 5' DNA nuclease